MKQLRVKTISLFVVLMCVAVGASAQTKATKFRIENEAQAVFGSLYVTVDGKEKKISAQAQQAWIINDGLHVVYSSSDGSGGFEGEGQSLHIYDVRTLKQKKIMSQYFMVDKIEEVITSQKKRALVVTLMDGGLGASYVSVVDPWRGEVFFRKWARILSRNGDLIVLGFYKEDDWEKLDGTPPVKVEPYKTERHNLNSLLLRKVIVNKPDKV